jgi:predicted transposase/invertase (TIGR01784 family)
MAKKTAGQRMPAKAKTKQKPNVEDLGIYINLLTDFGFKRIFGIKEVMLHFLNTVLADDIKDSIVDVHYDNSERLGITQYDRKAIYDLICTTGKNERIIVEMQAIWQEFYKDRTLFYASYLIQDQNVKKKNWDFRLHPIYSINLVNFHFDDDSDQSTEKYASYVQLTDRDTHRVFYDKLTFVYIELPRFTKELHELKTFFEQWMFVIRNLHELDNIPEKFRNEVFEKIFEEARIARMTKKEKDIYYTSLKNLSSMNIAQIEYNKLKKVNTEMRNENIEMRNENKEMRNANIEMRNANIEMHNANIEMHNANMEMRNANMEMRNSLAVMGKNIATKDKDLATMNKIIAEYKRKYGELN